jgi:hypothetical protein
MVSSAGRGRRGCGAREGAAAKCIAAARVNNSFGSIAAAARAARAPKSKMHTRRRPGGSGVTCTRRAGPAAASTAGAAAADAIAAVAHQAAASSAPVTARARRPMLRRVRRVSGAQQPRRRRPSLRRSTRLNFRSLVVRRSETTCAAPLPRPPTVYTRVAQRICASGCACVARAAASRAADALRCRRCPPPAPALAARSARHRAHGCTPRDQQQPHAATRAALSAQRAAALQALRRRQHGRPWPLRLPCAPLPLHRQAAGGRSRRGGS